MQNGICAFTGHREIKKEHEKQLPDLLLRAIEFAYGKGCRTFAAGGALGFDTVAAREIIRFRISHPDVRLRLVLPCKNQDERWSARQKENYTYTLRMADEITYVSDEYTKSCMMQRNHELVREADIVIAYSGKQTGGTAQTIKMAARLGKEIYNIYPALDKMENKND